MSICQRLTLGFLILGLLGLPTSARAACTINWTDGAGDRRWQSSRNWSPERLPGPGDDVCIGPSFDVTLSAGDQRINSLTSHGRLSITGGSLSIAAASAINNNFNLDGGTISGTGDLTINGPWLWSGGIMRGPGATTLAATRTLTLDSEAEKSLDGRTLNNDGTVTWLGGRIMLNNGAIIRNRSGGTFEAQSNREIVFGGTGPSPSFDNAGLFKKTISGTTAVGVAFNNTATVDVQFGYLNLTNGGASSGAFTIGASATLILTDGTFTLNSGARFDGAGWVEVLTSGSLNVAGATAINNSNFRLNRPLSGAGTLTVNSYLDWRGGTMSGPGVTAIATGGRLDISAFGDNILDGRSLNNVGYIYSIADRFLLNNGARVDNQMTGTFDARGTEIATSVGAAPRFTNAGWFVKDSGAQTTTVTIAFTNTGRISVIDRNLQFSVGYTQTAGATILYGGTLSSGPAPINIQGGILSGFGTITASQLVSSGQIRPGEVPDTTTTGTLTLNGNYRQTADGMLNIKIAGRTTDQFDQLRVSGTAELNGTLNISLLGGFRPMDRDSFQIMTFGARSGNFSPVRGPDLGCGTTLQPIATATDLALKPSSDIAVSINPPTAMPRVGGTQLFTAQVTGTCMQAVNWSVLEAPMGGTITPAGLYTAPAAPGVFNVVATSQADPTKSARVAVTVLPVINCTVNWTGGAGDGLWQTPRNWSTGALPGPTASVCIGAAFTVTLSSGSHSINRLMSEGRLVISGGSLAIAGDSAITNTFNFGGGVSRLTVAGNLMVTGTLNWTAATMQGPGTTTIAPGGVLNLMVGVQSLNGRTLNNYGTINLNGPDLQVISNAVINNRAAFNVLQTNDGAINTDASSATFNNAGTFTKSVGTNTTRINVRFNNTGTVEIGTGLLRFQNTFSQTAGTTRLNGGNLYCVTGFNLQGGSLTGSGTVTGNVTNGGQVDPGRAPGTGILSIIGDYTQTATGALNIKIGGRTVGSQFNQLSIISGRATLNGTLNISLAGGYRPACADPFAIMNFGSRSGTFATTSGLDLGGGLLFRPDYRAADLTLRTSTGAGPITVTINPTAVTLPTGRTQQFTATVTGDTCNTAVNWRVPEPSGGTVTTTGLYTAPASGGGFTVVATSQADPTRRATATVTVTEISVTINPTSATVRMGRTQQFTAQVSSTTDTRVTWSVQESGGGTVSDTGLYTPSTPGVFHVVATSVADSTRRATATVTVTEVVVAIYPPRATLPVNGRQPFTARASGDPVTTVTWSVQEAGGGTVSDTGLYTAPATTGIFHVVATSVADPSKSKIVLVAVVGSLPRFAYVANGESQTVSVYTIDANTGQLRANGYARAGTGPVSLMTDPSGRFLYVANAGSSNISAYTIDATTGRLTPITGSPFSAGRSPRSLMVGGPIGQFLYTANADSNDVSAYTIDSTTGRLTPITGSPFATRQRPAAVAVDPTGQFVYVTNEGSGNVSAYTIDGTSGALQEIPGSPFPAGTRPSSLTVEPTGSFVYVTNGGSNNVSAYTIDGTTGALRRIDGSPFPAGNGPEGLTVDPMGRYVYVTNAGDNTVSAYLINAQFGGLTRIAGSPFAARIGPAFVKVDPSGQFAYVLNRSSRDFSIYTIQPNGALAPAGTVRARGVSVSMDMTAGEAPVTYTPQFAYTTNYGSDDISAWTIEATSGRLFSVDDPFPAGGGPNSVAVDPLGRFAYVANRADDTLSAYLIDLDTNPGALTPISGSPFGAGITTPVAVTVDPSARFVYVANEASSKVSAYSIAADSGQLVQITGSPFDTGGVPKSVIVEPTGRFVYVTNNGTSNISGYSINADTGALTPIPGSPFPARGFPWLMAVEPTGRFAYVVYPQDFQVSVFTIDALTGALTHVGSIGTGSVPISVAVDPTGRFVYVADNGDTGYDVWAGAIDASTGALTRVGVVPVGGQPYSVSVDPSGQFVYVANAASNDVWVYAIDPISGALTRILSAFPAGVIPTSVITVGSIE